MNVKRLLRFGIVIFSLIVAVVLGALWGAQRLNTAPPGINTDGVVFSVEPGEHLGSISDRLANSSLIRSSIFLKALSYLKGTEREFQVGSYRIEAGMTTLGIHNLLVSGRELLIRVTVPEGMALSQIAERLEAQEITGAENFEAAAADKALLEQYGVPGESAEGFLYPDTYLFPKNYPAEKVAQVMIGRFFDELGEIYPKYNELEPWALYEKVVLASIIEREYRAPDEASFMASVFYNRLEANMKLQSCATVAYVITEELGMEYPEVLTYDDLELPSEYNTYWNRGLPPGPIANPGETALSAAFFPAESDYFYFVLKDPDAGRHEFTRSFNEHLSAKNLYLKKS